MATVQNSRTTQPDTPQTAEAFPPGSAIRQINRESVLLLTGGRVLLMQIAHPMVAEAVYHHSYVFQNPLKRLYRTLDLTLTMVFGTQPEAQQAVQTIEAAHRPATGHLAQSAGKHAAGATYNPRNPRQALWVFATLVEGAISGYERLVAPLDDTIKAEFYIQSTQVAQQMGVRPSYLPGDYAGLLTYMREAIADDEIHVSEKAREIAPFILGQSVPLVNLLAYPFYRMSVAMLPDALQAQFGYNVRGWETSLMDGFSRFSRGVLPYLPGRLRYVPWYHRARRRI
jgi:uncharacterized protein (DUF2236 family)